MQLTNAPKQVLDAIAAGFYFDDGGRDMRECQSMHYYDNNGDPEDSALIYRLWDSAESATGGVLFEVYDSGRVESRSIAADGSDQ